MKQWTIATYEIYTVYSTRDLGEKGVEEVILYRQPVWWWLVACIYHWYDMRIFKVPGFKLLERMLQARHRGDDLYLPLGAQQDLRCYALSHKHRTEIARLRLPQSSPSSGSQGSALTNDARGV